jgi:dTDP-4-dehydrorhamnose 3,5-epimerase
MGEMIQGVIVRPLRIIADERGKVMHMLRSDSELYLQFGEVYFSIINQGFIKGWKKHSKMTQHYAVPVGNIKLVLYDGRDDSGTRGMIQEVYIGESNYCLIRIPPGVWYAFHAEGKREALIVNCANIPHDPLESVSMDLNNEMIPYRWDL